MVDLFRYKHWDLVSKRGIYYAISVLMLIAGMVALFTQGLNQGIDFKGGGLVTYSVQGTIANRGKVINDVRTAIVAAGEATNDAGLKTPEVQIATSGTDDQILVRTVLVDKAGVDHNELLKTQIENSITPAVTKAVTDAGMQAPSLEGQENVTGTVSDELKRNAVYAVVIGSILIMIWIGIRYNIGGLGFRYSAGSILALAHDLLILVGAFAIFRDFLQVNSPFIAALLTVLGYSIHDTIVIYDRIRENIKLRKGRTFAETVNISLLETMARSVNTVLTVLFTLLALFFLGGPTLRDFVAALLIGIVVGAYSSIFLASQLLVSWAKGKDKVILPPGETVPAATVARPVTAAVASSAPVSAPIAAPQPTVSADAIQRARQAGKTSKRRR